MKRALGIGAAFGIAAACRSALTIVGDRESDTSPFTTVAAGGAGGLLSVATNPNNGTGEQNLFGAATAPDGSTWASGWYIDPSSGNHETLIEHGVGGGWSIDSSTANRGAGDNGFAGVAAVPGGGLWAVGVTANDGSYSTLIQHHC